MTEQGAKPAAKKTADVMDYGGRPFGRLIPDAETAMICEQDPVIRDKVAGDLKKMGFLVAQPATYKEALRNMRFHVFNIIFVDEDFEHRRLGNEKCASLSGKSQHVRPQTDLRRLISATLPTMTIWQRSIKAPTSSSTNAISCPWKKILRHAMSEHEDSTMSSRRRFTKQ